jgi:hypothetical protein
METSYIFSCHQSSRLVSGSGSDNQNSYPTCPCTDIKIPYETRTERDIKSLKYLFQLFFGFLPKLPFELLTTSTSTLTGQNKDKKNVIINQNVKAENCMSISILKIDKGNYLWSYQSGRINQIKRRKYNSI